MLYSIIIESQTNVHYRVFWVDLGIHSGQPVSFCQRRPWQALKLFIFILYFELQLKTMPDAAKGASGRLEVGERGERALKEGQTGVTAPCAFGDGNETVPSGATSPGASGAMPPSADSSDQDAVSGGNEADLAPLPCSKTAEGKGRPLAEATAGSGAVGTPAAFAAQSAAGAPALLQHAAAPPSTAPSAATTVRLTFSAPPKCLEGLVGAAASVAHCPA